MTLQDLKIKALEGEGVSRDEALWLLSYADLDSLCDAANEIARKWQGDEVD